MKSECLYTGKPLSKFPKIGRLFACILNGLPKTFVFLMQNCKKDFCDLDKTLDRFLHSVPSGWFNFAQFVFSIDQSDINVSKTFVPELLECVFVLAKPLPLPFKFGEILLETVS